MSEEKIRESHIRDILHYEALRHEKWEQEIEEFLDEEEEKKEKEEEIGLNYWTLLRDVYDPRRHVWKRIKRILKYVGLAFLGFLIFILVICVICSI